MGLVEQASGEGGSGCVVGGWQRGPEEGEMGNEGGKDIGLDDVRRLIETSDEGG